MIQQHAVPFHDLVMEASGNRLGRAIVSSIHGNARTTGRYHGSTSPENIAPTLTEHQRILDALNDHNAAALLVAVGGRMRRFYGPSGGER